MRKISLQQFHAECKAQGVKAHEDIAFKCPICGTIQSARDLIRAGAGATFADVERFIAFSCVGRWTNAGSWKKDEPPGRGCDWTLGGLLRLHTLEIEIEGQAYPRFELATPDEAIAHRDRALVA